MGCKDITVPGGGQDFGRSVKSGCFGKCLRNRRSPGTSSFIDYTTIKYNSFGVQLWVSRYNGPQNGYDESYSLVLDDSGNVYITGESYGGTTNEDYATVKYNSSGDQQWSVRYNGTGNLNDIASSISVDPSGYVSVTGRSDGTGTNADYATVHYSQPVFSNEPRYNGFPNGADYANAIATDASGNIYVTGQSKRSYDFF
ncbi:MAG: SBBP repeat-containing protein [Ignavibacteria bacterium]|nr:SBBP repeat-containing protein [Ignavibacteria bacterium]